MRFSLFLFVLLSALTSCTLLKPEGVLFHGSVWLMSQREVRAAIDAARTGEGNPSGTVESVIVHSRTELLVLLLPPRDIVLGQGALYVLVRKEAGQWRDVGYSIVYDGE